MFSDSIFFVQQQQERWQNRWLWPLAHARGVATPSDNIELLYGFMVWMISLLCHFKTLDHRKVFNMTDHAPKQKNVLATIENSMSKWKIYASISIFTTVIIGVWILFLVPVILFSTRPVDNVSHCQGNQQKRQSYFVDFFLGKLRLSIQRKLCLSIHYHKSNKS